MLKFTDFSCFCLGLLHVLICKYLFFLGKIFSFELFILSKTSNC